MAPVPLLALSPFRSRPRATPALPFAEPATTAPPLADRSAPMRLWFFSFLRLRYDSQTTDFAVFKCTNRWFFLLRTELRDRHHV